MTGFFLTGRPALQEDSKGQNTGSDRKHFGGLAANISGLPDKFRKKLFRIRCRTNVKTRTSDVPWQSPRFMWWRPGFGPSSANNHSTIVTDCLAEIYALLSFGSTNGGFPNLHYRSDLFLEKRPLGPLIRSRIGRCDVSDRARPVTDNLAVQQTTSRLRKLVEKALIGLSQCECWEN
jgi:hypothetical protein